MVCCPPQQSNSINTWISEPAAMIPKEINWCTLKVRGTPYCEIHQGTGAIYQLESIGSNCGLIIPDWGV